MSQHTRRGVLTAVGTGCIGTLAGCASTAESANTSDTDAETDSAVQKHCYGDCSSLTSLRVRHTLCIGCENHINVAIAFREPATRKIEFVFYDESTVVNERSRVVEGMAGSWVFRDPAPDFDHVELYITTQDTQSG